MFSTLKFGYQMFTDVMSGHGIIGLAIRQQHAEAVRSFVGLPGTGGVFVGQESEDIVREQDFWSF
jgi:hypothetical protein